MTVSKGQRTKKRILDEAALLFAAQGYDGTSLRQIAAAAGLREPGLYNHFAGKQALYEDVISRALQPMTQIISQALREARELRDYTELPPTLTDLLRQQPQAAALLQQALQGTPKSSAARLLQTWLDRLVCEALENPRSVAPAAALDRPSLAIHLIALLNLTTGYFLAQSAFDTLASGHLTDDDNIARQKHLLRRVVRAMLVS